MHKHAGLTVRSFFAALLPAALLAAGCGAGRPAAGVGGKDPFHSPMSRIVQSVVAARDRIPGRKIVVYELSDISGRSIPEGRLVAERLTTSLALTGEFRVIERSRLEAAMKELNLSASGVIDAGTAARAGRVLGAEAVITGTLTRVNGRFEINARAIEVQTGSIIAAAVEQVEEADLRVAEARPRPAEQRPAAVVVQAQPAVYQPPAPKPGPARALPAGWEEWPGWDGNRGSYSFDGEKLLYRLASRQHDGIYKPSADGYYPGLLLAREISGERWTLDMKANYGMRASGGNWLSLVVWFGKAGVRPSYLSPDMAFAIFYARQQDDGYGVDNYMFNRLPKGDMLRMVPADRVFLRIKRDGARLTLETSADGEDYDEGFSVLAPEAETAKVQKIVLGGQAFSNTSSYAEYEYIKLNGAPLF